MLALCRCMLLGTLLHWRFDMTWLGLCRRVGGPLLAGVRCLRRRSAWRFGSLGVGWGLFLAWLIGLRLLCLCHLRQNFGRGRCAVRMPDG